MLRFLTASRLAMNPNLISEMDSSIDVIASILVDHSDSSEDDPYPHTIHLVLKDTVLNGTYVKKAKREGDIVP